MEFVDSFAGGHAGTATRAVRPATVPPVSTVRPVTPAAAVDPRTASVRHYEGGQLVWRVQCGDLISRERAVTVFVEDNQVVLVSPPGETARLTSGQLGQLRAALNEAAKMAER
ncbi:hypothetical protein AMES_0086 [Amycolatopsis mediterranei S699]|uniref:Uncharacterized protein n=2 Tax=Amycolatopsis mediterranei TaxID=33910 RepID=A0A0H3CUF5_AMYMU|nr:hypothetical protein [Amycolatopsis mediterranei]ADJ41913.1 conserved hypothetical protein [Amycolatopsis mediterranei U32]AEK38585.1 hypothetical protein RAM_00450 [Amycolatopsis mediterranei S699]AFO73623.1 hypothetical protein AMES_0086 [Amycolatopsis mediterranei S699]AGT80752.1 hypothetical protein B737_0087 [Amycolatopsis mediterranei RB]KDO09059.1 hypothetical protein DV26_20220 [Amycolatopsis mediterranei]